MLLELQHGLVRVLEVLHPERVAPFFWQIDWIFSGLSAHPHFTVGASDEQIAAVSLFLTGKLFRVGQEDLLPLGGQLVEVWNAHVLTLYKQMPFVKM